MKMRMAIDSPTFALPPTFLSAAQSGGGRYSIAGIPLDIGTTNRSGARFGPGAIRHASRMLVGTHPVTGVDTATLPLVDIGDFQIAFGDLSQSLAVIEQQAAAVEHLVSLGGEHSITLPLLRALAKRNGPQALIHFDAHVDTWPENFGQAYGHGSVFYHAIREELVDPKRMIQIGIRSPAQREVIEWTRAQGVTIVTAEDVHERGVQSVAQQIHAVIGGANCYVSFDIDALDPAFAPGTGTPEIGGLTSSQAQSLMRRLEGLHFSGMDLVEVAPAYDVSEITALAAASIVFEYLALLPAGVR
jgi:agmatinase